MRSGLRKHIKTVHWAMLKQSTSRVLILVARVGAWVGSDHSRGLLTFACRMDRAYRVDRNVHSTVLGPCRLHGCSGRVRSCHRSTSSCVRNNLDQLCRALIPRRSSLGFRCKTCILSVKLLALTCTSAIAQSRFLSACTIATSSKNLCQSSYPPNHLSLTIFFVSAPLLGTRAASEPYW
jgi:hypothetical protein